MLALRSENRRLREELAGEFQGLIGDSAAMRDTHRIIRRVGPTDVSVLITGESGTGKELVARALHVESPRHANAFVALNCSAIPSALVESELFGHLRGSFTGADRDREGCFQAASRGTLFLDEVGDLEAAAQAKLLRTLEERVVTPVGGNCPIPVDVRVVAATNRPLDSLISEGRFREDLLYRLRVVTIHLPPLRDRREEIPVLAAHFLAHFAELHGRPIADLADRARRALLAYDWPGNVSATARTLGVHRQSLQKTLRRLDISRGG